MERRPATLALEALVVAPVVIEPESEKDRPDDRAVGGGYGREFKHRSAGPKEKRAEAFFGALA
jgi:hypothetical protein